MKVNVNSNKWFFFAILLLAFTFLLIRSVPSHSNFFGSYFEIGTDKCIHIQLAKSLINNNYQYCGNEYYPIKGMNNMTFAERYRIYPPGFHYVLAGLSLVVGMPVESTVEYVVAPLLFFSIPIILFFLTKKIFNPLYAFLAVLLLLFVTSYPYGVFVGFYTTMLVLLFFLIFVTAFYYLKDTKNKKFLIPIAIAIVLAILLSHRIPFLSLDMGKISLLNFSYREVPAFIIFLGFIGSYFLLKERKAVWLVLIFVALLFLSFFHPRFLFFLAIFILPLSVYGLMKGFEHKWLLLVIFLFFMLSYPSEFYMGESIKTLLVERVHGYFPVGFDRIVPP